MTKVLKIIAAVFGFVVILMVAAAIMIPMFVNPNDFKGEIIGQVEKTTGRKLELAGDIGLTVFPWLGLELGATTLGNAPGFGEQPFLRSERVQVRVKLLPLLQKRVEMDTVALEGLELNLARDKSGKSNWDDLLQMGAPAQATPPAEAPAGKPDAAAEAAPQPFAALALGGVDLKGGRITWDDRQQGERYAIKDLNLETGPIAPGEPVAIDLSLAFDAPPRGLTGNLGLEGTVDYDLEGRRYGVKPLDFTAKLKGKSVPGGALDLKLTADHVNADLKQDAATVSGLALDAGGASLSGDIQVQNLTSDKPAATYTLRAKGRELSGLIKAVGEAFNIAGIPKSLTAFSIDMGMSGTAAKIVVEPLKLQAALQAAGAKGRPLNLDLRSARVDLDLTSKAVAVKAGALKITGDDVVPLLKELGVSNPGLETLAIGLSVDTEFSGTGTKLTLAPFNVKAALAGETLPNKSAEVTLATRAEIDLDQQTAALNDLALQGLGLDLRGAAQAENIQKDPKFAGTLKLKPFDARKLLTQLGQAVPETTDPKALTNVGFETALAGSKNSINLSNLALRLDDTRINGTMSAADFSQPAIGFKLDMDGIDADRYLPREKAEKAEGDSQKGDKPKSRAKKDRGARDAASGTDSGVSVGTLGGLNLKGVLTLGKLKIANATLTRLSVAVNAKNGDINLNPIEADLYQGKIAGSVGLDTRAVQPKLSMNESLTGVQIEPLLKDLSGEAKIAGTANLKAQLNAAGASADAIKRTLSGKAAFQFLDGALIGVNLGQLMRKAQAGFVGKVDENAKTDFSEMGGTLIFDQGVVRNQDLVLKSPFLRIAGQGQADLVSERIDYTLNTTLSAIAEGQDGTELTDIKGITIPIKVSGTFDDPSYAPDVAGLAKAKAEKALEKNKEKITEKLKEKLGEDAGGVLGETLGGLLGGKRPQAQAGDAADQSGETAPAPAEAAPAQDPGDKDVQEKLKDLLRF
ncbi:MAG: AsmA family protein [Gammaproteobacteria bacterium]